MDSDTPRRDAAVSGIPAQMDISVKTQSLDDLCCKLERELEQMHKRAEAAEQDAAQLRVNFRANMLRHAPHLTHEQIDAAIKD